MSDRIESRLKEARRFPPPPDFVARAQVSAHHVYEAMHRQSIDDPDEFWREQTADLVWRAPWTTFSEWTLPTAKFFVGAKLNVSESCLDRHLTTARRTKAAIIWEGEPGDVRTVTYFELHRQVVRAAAALADLGVMPGDRVAIYMSMVPEAVVAMLACARIGAVHSVVFGGFSAEALRDALTNLSIDEIQVKVIASGVGGITVSDVQLASASKARIIGFNVRADAGAREALKETGVELRYYSIIYEAIDDVKQMMTGMLQPEIKEQILGIAQVRDVFRSSKFGVVAGCLVTEGTVRRNNPIRVLRESVVIFEGQLESLRRFKDDVNEVRAGTECGIGVKNYQDVRVGDQIECFARIEVARTLQ